ncbi:MULTISPECIES: protein YgfX [unclassified Pseudoalteromonas]|uniref:protein YgfX n=1 Tax=unclassified Pseudoalteromonas TaxID=194690 RepID=UPI002097CD9E|nr:protein YgfX [Pseudoalteromonas sp. XMcav2-N]MCO7187046.1 hypothetical protein [Pseudoalteromonas sp. XMcav2-N]
MTESALSFYFEHNTPDHKVFVVFFCCLALALSVVAPALWWWHIGTCLLGYACARHRAHQYFISTGHLGLLPEHMTVIVSGGQQQWQGQVKAAQVYFHCALLLTVKTEQRTRHIGIMRHAMKEEHWRHLCRHVFEMA